MTTISGDGGSALRKLAVRLEEVPKAAQAQVRRSVREAAEDVRRQAAQDASWSRRIPGSLVVRVSFAGARAGAYVAASARLAPDARPYESILGNAQFRHPLNFPNQRKGGPIWVNQPSRPFLAPALERGQDKAVDRINDAVTRGLADAGL